MLTCCFIVFSTSWKHLGSSIDRTRHGLTKYPSLFEALLQLIIVFAVFVGGVAQQRLVPITISVLHHFDTDSTVVSRTNQLSALQNDLSIIDPGMLLNSREYHNVDIGLPIGISLIPLMYSALKNTLIPALATITTTTMDAVMYPSSLTRLFFASAIASVFVLINAIKRRRPLTNFILESSSSSL
ncbi:hypothetical protein SAMD00019534_118630 [Acytostelium subglobosum LB1]|uniref:hypothetical protein n=1 Tax=Acytostelium subglobosum LB1 TaxID=1410327 RepID=UPI000644C772|nr:hypothetical protein SAMD00019534_118630 [Acytostelium subglobosum LB1]GAM28687.1 hypothetical protein SAMD00019534_118630 [Acytostelium subglobosum LB1]|eukprot:XP_012748465.1 hypothetical protein SAMD00019534_118630 [Acytostelium subglobosum LB1]